MFEELGRIDREEFHRVWELPPALTGRSCKRHLFACHVTPCGTIFACVGVTIPLGNVRKEPLREILELSEVLENLRAFDRKGEGAVRKLLQDDGLLWLPGGGVSTDGRLSHWGPDVLEGRGRCD